MLGLGLGDAASAISCGDNPCGFMDYIYASDACLAYKLCVNPNDTSAILESQGLIAGSGTILGTTAGQTVSNAISSLITNQDGSPNLIVLGIGLIVAFVLLDKKK